MLGVKGTLRALSIRQTDLLNHVKSGGGHPHEWEFVRLGKFWKCFLRQGAFRSCVTLSKSHYLTSLTKCLMSNVKELKNCKALAWPVAVIRTWSAERGIEIWVVGGIVTPFEKPIHRSIRMQHSLEPGSLQM